MRSIGMQLETVAAETKTDMHPYRRPYLRFMLRLAKGLCAQLINNNKSGPCEDVAKNVSWQKDQRI